MKKTDSKDQWKSAIKRAKVLLPLPDLLRKLGLNPPGGDRGNMPSPFRGKAGEKCKTPSFSVFKRGAEWGWKDRSGGGEIAGDEITFLEKFEGLSRSDAMRRFVELAGITSGDADNASEPTKDKESVSARALQSDVTGPDWIACVNALTDKHCEKIAAWRGYPLAFVV